MTIDTDQTPPLEPYAAAHVRGDTDSWPVRLQAADVDITVQLVIVTPERAREYLARNERNRNFSHSNTDGLAAAMRAGEWEFNGAAIVLDANGDLVDGQHRLAAIARTGVAVPLLVVAGVRPIKAQDVIDIGAKRSLNSALRIHGYNNANALAGAANNLIPLIKCGLPANPTNRPSIPAGVRFVEANPSLSEVSIPVAERTRNAISLPGGPGAALHFIFSLVDPSDALDFFQKATKGEGLYEGDPIYALRSALSPDTKRSARHSLPIKMRVAYTIKAWNAYRLGQQIKTLRWAPGGAKPEKFPDWRQTADDPDLGMDLLT
jgi:hypothetical protein